MLLSTMNKMVCRRFKALRAMTQFIFMNCLVPDGHTKNDQRPSAGKPRIARAGFTLLEVMIALSVVAIALVSVYKLYSQNLLMAESQRFYSLAPLLAQEKLAELEMDGSQAPPSGTGTFGSDFPQFSWEIDSTEVQP